MCFSSSPYYDDLRSDSCNVISLFPILPFSLEPTCLELHGKVQSIIDNACFKLVLKHN